MPASSSEPAERQIRLSTLAAHHCQELIDERLSQSEDEEIKILCTKWYILDENAFPEAYNLKPLKSLDDDSFWKEALPKLSDFLKNIPFFEPNENVIVGRSVTEYEAIMAMAMDDENQSRIKWAQRKVTDGGSVELDPWQFYAEWQSKPLSLLCTNLKASMESKIVKRTSRASKWQRKI